MEAEAEPVAPLPVQTVYTTLENALSFSADVRTAAEAQLRAWEADSAPGFIGSLVSVIAAVQTVPEVRLGGRVEGNRHCP